MHQLFLLRSWLFKLQFSITIFTMRNLLQWDCDRTHTHTWVLVWVANALFVLKGEIWLVLCKVYGSHLLHVYFRVNLGGFIGTFFLTRLLRELTWGKNNWKMQFSINFLFRLIIRSWVRLFCFFFFTFLTFIVFYSVMYWPITVLLRY